MEAVGNSISIQPINRSSRHRRLPIFKTAPISALSPRVVRPLRPGDLRSPSYLSLCLAMGLKVADGFEGKRRGGFIHRGEVRGGFIHRGGIALDLLWIRVFSTRQ